MKYLVMKMYDEIQKLIAPNTLSSFEFTKLEELLKDYTENEIIEAYKKAGYKPINYITKILSKKAKTTHWLNQEIKNQPIDEETKKEYDDFQKFLKEFREN